VAGIGVNWKNGCGGGVVCCTICWEESVGCGENCCGMAGCGENCWEETVGCGENWSNGDVGCGTLN